MANEEYWFIKPVAGRTVFAWDGLGTLRQRPIAEAGEMVPMTGAAAPYYRAAVQNGDAIKTDPPRAAKPKTTAKEG